MRYKLFGRGSGLRVSELALGSALFGTTWGYGTEPAEVRRILDRYAEAGGNFIDTADWYQKGEAESILSDFLLTRRDRFVLGTKYSLGAEKAPNVLTTGNATKNMARSLEASLKRLKTDRVDLFWVHMPDGLTSAEHIVRGLEDLARAGKILYAGFSDFPAWRVARAATIAELRGSVPIIGVQTEYSLVERSGDREQLPMASALGLGVTAWSPLGGGLLTGKYRRGETGRATTFGACIHKEDDAQKTAILDELAAVAREHAATSSQVALAWLLARGLIPILGARTCEQLEDNLGANELRLTPAQFASIDKVSALALGFPHDFLQGDVLRVQLAGGNPDLVDKPDTPPG